MNVFNLENKCPYKSECPVIKNNGEHNVPMVYDSYIGNMFNIENPITNVFNEHPLVVFIGEAPATEEEVLYIPFVGSAGKILRNIIYESNILEEYNVFFTNCVRCRPIDVKNAKAFRTPNPDEISFCSHKYLITTIQHIINVNIRNWVNNPKDTVVDINNLYFVLLGHTAVKTFIDLFGKDNITNKNNEPINTTANMTDIIKYRYNVKMKFNGSNNTYSVITYAAFHPSYFARNIQDINNYVEHLNTIFKSINKFQGRGK